MGDDLSAAIMKSWSISFWPTALLLLTAVLYGRGWRLAAASRPRELPVWRMLSFFAGLAILWLAISSPIDALGQFLLVAHMTQHLLLMSVVPPLILLGAPTVPLLRGLPRSWIKEVLATWINFHPFHAIGGFLSRPLVGWLAMNLAYAVWHVPAMYELALCSNDWHYVEHACFLFGSLAFWWHVIQPWPSRAHGSRWLMVPYIVLADIVNTIISASLAFSSHVLYPTYATVPRLFEISALEDQMAAGAGMWVVGSMISLVPLMAVIIELLSSSSHRRAIDETGTPHPARPIPRSFDLLRLPLIGHLLRWRFGRLLLQACSFAGLTLVVLHGLQGTQLSALNLAGGFLWTILRPLLFLLVLCVANVFCMACPFTFPRELARLAWSPRWKWPTRLRGKWPAVALTLLFFWAYLQFDLWNWPSATAWLLIAYVGCAFLIDVTFQGASFCKYICPIGQFNFVTSMVAPLEIGVKQQAVCTNCSGKDCLRGNQTQRGCELQLYLPQKVGNLDCTLCMDCVKACPHDNVQISAHEPLRDFTSDPRRSSIRRLSQREDIAVLLLMLSSFSLVNAAAMTAPMMELTAGILRRYAFLRQSVFTLLFTVVLCGVVLLSAIGLARVLRSVSTEKNLKAIFCRFSLASLPLGLAMWAAHLLFHLTTAGSNLTPVLDQFLADMGSHARLQSLLSASSSMGASAVCSPQMFLLTSGGGGTNLLSLQVWILNAGLLVTLYLLWRIARQIGSGARNQTILLLLSSFCALLYYAGGIWIFSQPMQMLGMGGQ